MGAALQTDLYELTMAAAYLREGSSERRAVFELYVRHLPPSRGYGIAAGLEAALRFLEELRFTPEELEALEALPALAEGFRVSGFRRRLEELRFTCDVWAMPEGTAFFGGEPLLRVEGPLIEAQLVETRLLSVLNHASAIASKAARFAWAARPASVVEFGARRAHPDAAVDAARAAYIGGCDGTSNLEAARRFGIPIFGTAAHSFTMSHESELEAFRSYIETFPDTSTLLIDTYDTLEGARRAAAVGGERLRGVRLDSGNLEVLAFGVRRILDDAGLSEARIVVSGDLDENVVQRLLSRGAPIDVFGVGTRLTVSTDAPALGGVYKLVSIEREGRMEPATKLSEAKIAWPGAKQVYRHRGREGELAFDELGLADEPAPEGAESLLVQVMRGGQRMGEGEPLSASRARAVASVAALPEPVRRIARDRRPARYEVRPTRALVALLEEARANVAAEAGLST
ncbi:nicotinate phosphoribosyltransferase [Vulgatibacter incomptus]|uniref:Nicotinate phosphoribosyltransferase n=1 Tax=Vulgatibacter incomptus TaxID=1391653 RepID=A0A0K1PAN4_9BACT|nr:nicotinate phosphoribosyltransferase [Vulgatibacter incomptus]AKU90174.1 Nicotinate phosphoribosyltransferase [Vulgatibacter incomptus]